jgi:hypothetical protein
VRDERGKDLPRYVEQELRRYLRCGLLHWGFVRVVCRACRKEILVAYACKCRGACPRCNARRMCGSAAHPVDHVLIRRACAPVGAHRHPFQGHRSGAGELATISAETRRSRATTWIKPSWREQIFQRQGAKPERRKKKISLFAPLRLRVFALKSESPS